MEKRIVRIRNTEIGSGLPKICVPLVAANAQELMAALKTLKQEEAAWRANASAGETAAKTVDGAVEIPASEPVAIDSGASAVGISGNALYDLVEWRADFYEGIEQRGVREEALRMIRDSIGERPLLFTFRTAAEGGNRLISDEDYFALNEAAAKSGLTDMVDIEVNRDEDRAKELAVKLRGLGVYALGSYHDFEKTPPFQEMVDRLCRMQELGMDITKLAVMPLERRDVLELLRAAEHMETVCGDRPCVTMSMGRLGVLSRFAGGLTGSAITFGTAGKASAPGQTTAAQLRRFLSETLDSCEQ